MRGWPRDGPIVFLLLLAGALPIITLRHAHKRAETLLSERLVVVRLLDLPGT
jgi:hypothetical protein